MQGHDRWEWRYSGFVTARTVSSVALYDDANLVFVGDADVARRKRARHPSLQERDESIRVQVAGPRRVSIQNHPVSVTVARSLAGLLERAVESERGGSVAGITLDVLDDGVLRVMLPEGHAHLDFGTAQTFASILRDTADEADPDEPASDDA